MIKKSILFLFILLITGCSSWFNSSQNDYATEHLFKLKQHFLGVKRQDISTLIAETTQVSNKLKMSGQTKYANKFDSYIDVLTYGQHTISESIRDVRCLMKDKSIDAAIEASSPTKCCIILPF